LESNSTARNLGASIDPPTTRTFTALPYLTQSFSSTKSKSRSIFFESLKSRSITNEIPGDMSLASSLRHDVLSDALEYPIEVAGLKRKLLVTRAHNGV
jgi:hypothetical protein